jgi:nicotinic acid mononucleotide adenylyltransferase
MESMSNNTTVRRRQICLFGTSANPPTGSGGHVGIVQALSALNRFDEIRVLPVYQHTFSSKRNQLVKFEHRVNMCKIAFEVIPTAIVSNAEKESFLRVAKDK